MEFEYVILCFVKAQFDYFWEWCLRMCLIIIIIMTSINVANKIILIVLMTRTVSHQLNVDFVFNFRLMKFCWCSTPLVVVLTGLDILLLFLCHNLDNSLKQLFYGSET